MAGEQVLDGSGGKVKVGVECRSSGDDEVLVLQAMAESRVDVWRGWRLT